MAPSFPRHSRPCVGMLLLVVLWAGLPGRAAAQSEGAEVSVYGFVLLNAAYNTGAPQPVDIPVLAGGGEEGSFLMTARQSRFGVQLRHENDGLRVRGALELDLWGLLGSVPAGGPGQSAPRTRLAYFALDLDETSSFLFGQSWTVVAPLSPTSLAHVSIPGFSSSGNLWNRLPQIRYTHRAAPLLVEAAILRPYAGEVAPAVNQNDFLSAGEYSKKPFLEARAAYASEAATVGVSGRYGWLDLRNDALGDDETTTYVLAADAQLTLGDAGLSGEVYTGQNTRGLFGLAGTAIAAGDIVDAEATGGWAQLSFTVDRVNVNAGLGVERVEDGPRNRTLFGNAIYTLARLPVAFAVEVNQIETEPISGQDFDNLTLNFAARYSFSR